MKTERSRRVLVLVALLPLGAVLSNLWIRPAPIATADLATELILRPIDVGTQLALMLVAALGIRALLPGEDEG